MAEDTGIKGPFGSIKSEGSYLSNRVDVISARNKFSEANTALLVAQRDFNATSTTSKNYQNLANTVKAAQSKMDAAKTELDRILNVAKTDYKKLVAEANKPKEKAAAETLDKKIEGERLVLQRLIDSGQSTAAQEAVIKDLLDKKNKTGKYAPTPSSTGGAVGEQKTDAQLRNYQDEITAAANYVRKMKPKERLDLANLLTKAGFYSGPLVNTYSDDLVNAYKVALRANYSRSQQWGEEVAWNKFIADKILETSAAKAATGGKGGPGVPQGTVSISTASEAAAKVEAVFLRELKRLPTPEELATYSEDLINEEKKPSSMTKAIQKNIGGVLVTEYTGGLDRDQFLATKIRKLPEFKERKTAARTLTVQDLGKTARANGLDLNKNFGADVITSWVKRVENGEDIDIFKNVIRKSAAIGLPQNIAALIDSGADLETIYAPYKRTMASILELPVDGISLDDPTLRSAIGPDKPMSIFDFEKQLRRDRRWQYTDQARQAVSSVTLSVLRDFGFQG